MVHCRQLPRLPRHPDLAAAPLQVKRCSARISYKSKNNGLLQTAECSLPGLNRLSFMQEASQQRSYEGRQYWLLYSSICTSVIETSHSQHTGLKSSQRVIETEEGKKVALPFPSRCMASKHSRLFSTFTREHSLPRVELLQHSMETQQARIQCACV